MVQLQFLQRSHRFNILRNVKYIYQVSSASILSAINVNQTQSIVISKNGYTSVYGGTYGNGRALAFYKAEIIDQFQANDQVNWDKNIYANMAKWLTNDACINLSNCMIHIDQYRSNLHKDNIVVLFQQDAIINSSDLSLNYKLESGSWGIIFSGTYWNKIDLNQKYLLNKYGICVSTEMDEIDSKVDLKWCRSLSKIPKIKCN